MKIIKEKYPYLSKEEYIRIDNFIKDKCSAYYFLTFLKDANSNVEDAIEFFLFDEKIRSLLIRYVLRFEIQIKNDFSSMVEKTTNSRYFWQKEKYCLDEVSIKKRNHKYSLFENMVYEVKESCKELAYQNVNITNNIAFYSITLGTFINIMNYIKPIYKEDFIKKYTKFLPTQDYYIFYHYMCCIRTLRNRLAHGNHIITYKLEKQFQNYEEIKELNYIDNTNDDHNYFELILGFLYQNLSSKDEFKHELTSLINKNISLIKRNEDYIPIKSNILEKIFNN